MLTFGNGHLELLWWPDWVWSGLEFEVSRGHNLPRKLKTQKASFFAIHRASLNIFIDFHRFPLQLGTAISILCLLIHITSFVTIYKVCDCQLLRMLGYVGLWPCHFSFYTCWLISPHFVVYSNCVIVNYFACELVTEQ